MGLVLTNTRHYKDIADAIRLHFDTNDKYLPSEMAELIRRMSITAIPVEVITETKCVNSYTVNARSALAPQLLADSLLSIDKTMFDVTVTRG